MLPYEDVRVLPADDIARFVRCVFAETGCKDFTLQRIGSGFTFAIDRTVLLLTARHVIENNVLDSMSVVLPPLDVSKKWWPSDLGIHLKAGRKAKGDSAFGDLAIYTMHTPPTARALLNKHDFLTIPNSLDFHEGLVMTGFGYPDGLAEYDPDSRCIVGERTELNGFYAGPTLHQGIHMFRSPQLRDIRPNGMSGGPVTVKDISGNIVLAGVIVQGSSESQLLHFVSVDWVSDALRLFIGKLLRARSEIHGDRIDRDD